MGALASCQGSDPLLIGYVGPLTGKYSDLGVQGRNGVRLAIEHVNEAGGLRGRPVRLLAVNDFSTSNGTLEAFRSLASQGVRAAVGPMTSGQAVAAWPVMQDFDGLIISPTVATPSLSGRRDFFFRVISTNVDWGEALADYAANVLRLRSIVSVGDKNNAEYVKTFIEAFERRFTQLGGKIAAQIFFRTGDRDDWKPLLDTLDTYSPDGLLLVTSARDAADIARKVAVRRSPIQLLGPTWPASRDLLFFGGPAVENAVFATGFVDHSDYPPLVKFQRDYQARYGYNPSFAAAYGYEAATILLRGLEVGADSPDSFRDFLSRTGEFEGVYGKLRFDEYGDVVRSTRIIRVENGEFVNQQ
ncbi:ABC transporter substrate-binding protein [Paucidesulfovibrio longus]|uniref:ABC transporter substrate-binding protein n=1 Tax=Paucidesulfovibrio longus TaxID=889 RepID=UPI00058D1DC1|nr:ABC transporter substrate-binding protein [Paucidesulfovibrio longus]